MELIVLSDLLGPPDKQGQQKVVRTNIESKMLTNAMDIRYVEEVINRRGTVVKGVCAIKLGEESFRIKHSYESIRNLVSTNLKAKEGIGFKYKGRK